MSVDSFDAVMRCGNARKIQRMMDKNALGMVILKYGAEWVVTYRGHILYSGPFDCIKRHIAQVIADAENQSEKLVVGG